MNQSAYGATNLFSKKISGKGERVEGKTCRKVTNGPGSLTVGKDCDQMTWKEYFEDIYDVETDEQAIVYICGSESARDGN